MDENLRRLRSRALGAKHSLALREFALGIEALERFVRAEPLRRDHECVFGVLAPESEPVDPRLWPKGGIDDGQAERLRSAAGCSRAAAATSPSRVTMKGWPPLASVSRQIICHRGVVCAQSPVSESAGSERVTG
jgi:hypothetical protein